MRASRSCFSWLALALALCVAVVPAQGTAVCYGADGHVGIGPAGSCPCDDGHDDAPAPRDGAPGLDDHGPCVDVVVASPDLVDQAAPRVDVEGHEVAAPPTTVPFPSVCTDAGRHALRVAPRPPPPMRGVVLLI